MRCTHSLAAQTKFNSASLVTSIISGGLLGPRRPFSIFLFHDMVKTLALLGLLLLAI